MKKDSKRPTFLAFLILMLLCFSELPVFLGDAFIFHASARPPDQPVSSSPLVSSSVVATTKKLPIKAGDSDEAAIDAINKSIHQTSESSTTPSNFTLVTLPDPQYYSQYYPWIFDNQTQWVVDNVESMNIAFVSQQGDLVNSYSDLSQWNNANHSLSMLDNHVPWGVLPGYNDGVYAGNLVNYNNYFGYSRFYGESWYGGGYQNTNTNSFQLFSVGKDEYLIFDFQYGPSDSVLRWANRTINNYPGKRVIVTTHYYLNETGFRTTIGETMWQKFVKPHADQIFLVLCAGLHAEARRTDIVNGHSVYQLLANYQTRTPYGGNGWLRTLTFCPAEDKIYVKTYSPYLNSFETDSDSQFTLNYSMTHPSYTLAVNVTPANSGTVSRNNTGPLYYYGDKVQLTAEPNPGWTFSNWSGDLTGNNSPAVIVMDGDKTVTAAFIQIECTLTVTVSPLGGGMVWRNNTGPYHYDDRVNLTAIPTIGWAFSNWSGDLIGNANPAVIIMDENKTVTATFTQLEYILETTVSPIDGGSVNMSDKGPYHYGDWVELTALPNAGWKFDTWSGDLSHNTSATSVFIDGNKTVTAIFVQSEYMLTVNTSPTEGGSVNRSNTGPYHYGDEVQLTAIPSTGWAFSGWGGDLSGSVNPVLITMNSNKTVSAAFTYHDVAVIGIAPSFPSVYAGNRLNVSVTVSNKGLNTESFNVTLFCNSTSVASQSVSSLTPNSTLTLTFAWNTSGYAYGYYTLSASATPVSGETNTFDNTLTYYGVTLRIPGDVNANGIVDILDAAGVSAHWYPGPPIGPLAFDPNFDINGDGLIDVLDVALVSAHWTGPT